MSIFFIRVWIDGSDIIAVATGQGPIQSTGAYGNATFIDAASDDDFVEAGTLLPSLTYENNVLSSSLVTLLPSKDVTSLLAQAGYGGQSVYNWADGNKYQWFGNPWGATPITANTVTSIADTSATTAVAGARSYLATIFRRATSQPATPTGGSYNFDTQTLTPPSGWSTTVPAGTDPLWLSQVVATSPTPDGTDTTLDWGVPVAFAQDGNDGERGPGRWYIDIDPTVYNLPIAESQADNAWNAVSGTGDIPLRPRVYDQVIFYEGTQSNPTRQQAFICTSVTSDTVHTWNEQEELIDGDLLVTGTVTADRLVIGDSSLSADIDGGLLVQGGNITSLRDNFYSALTPIDGTGFSTPPVKEDLSLVGGNVISVPPGFTADLQIVVTFEHGYFNLPGFNDDWGLYIEGAFAGTPAPLPVLYERYNPTMTLETDYASVVVVQRNLVNPSADDPTNYNVYVFWGGGSADIQLLRCLTSVFVRFK